MFATLLAILSPPAQAADEGLSNGVGQPGYYGRLDVAGYPKPHLLNRQALAVNRVSARQPAIYLRVPPGHAKKWRKYCKVYDACGERVYFVQNAWYKQEFSPRYLKRGPEGEDQMAEQPRGGKATGHGKAPK